MPNIANMGNIPSKQETTESQLESKDKVVNTTQEQTSVETITNNYAEAAPLTGTSIPTPIIHETKVPIVVFVGPPASGKSMILVRLAKYLYNHGFSIEADETFLNTATYRKDCAKFMQSLHTTTALPGTVEFLLVNVYDKDKNLVAKLLEAPGEDFYTPEVSKRYKNKKLQGYLSTIMTSKNPKSYVMLLDLDSKISFRNDPRLPSEYTERFLNYFYKDIHPTRDRIILLYNKIDMTRFGSINGCTDERAAKADAALYYQQLFNSMKVTKFVFWELENFAFKTFCTGKFTDEIDDNGNAYQTYNIADNVYPRELWKEIIRRW